MSATTLDGLSTFLLEMALDKRQMKERLAAVLLEERKTRGHGDPRRFAQPAMAGLLGYSARQYQRLENADDASLPVYSDLIEILEKLGRPTSDIFGEEDVEPETLDEPASSVSEDVRLGRLESTLERVLGLVQEVRDGLLEQRPAPPVDHAQDG
jgi:transcriptional regulator with XRE-family HTH domain